MIRSAPERVRPRWAAACAAATPIAMPPAIPSGWAWVTSAEDAASAAARWRSSWKYARSGAGHRRHYPGSLALEELRGDQTPVGAMFDVVDELQRTHAVVAEVVGAQGEGAGERILIDLAVRVDDLQ